jgi:hypothetical protein
MQGIKTIKKAVVENAWFLQKSKLLTPDALIAFVLMQ